jgi:hypothetical protein
MNKFLKSQDSVTKAKIKMKGKCQVWERRAIIIDTSSQLVKVRELIVKEF